MCVFAHECLSVTYVFRVVAERANSIGNLKSISELLIHSNLSLLIIENTEIKQLKS